MYYIVGKASYDDNNKFIDTNDMNLYWELGWEIMANYPIIKRKYKLDEIKNNDIIVTRKGLEFLYNSTFQNVIDFENFKKIPEHKNHLDYYFSDHWAINKNIDVRKKDVVELMESGFNMRSNPNFYDFKTGKYKYFEDDRDVLTSMNLLNTEYLHNNEKFVILCVRRRNYNKELAIRNSDEKFTIEILEHFKKKYDKIFILGNDCEKYESNNIKIINFQEYASLINNENCDITISSLTSYYFLSLYISKVKKFIVVDFGDHDFVSMQNDITGLALLFKYSNSNYKYFHHKNLKNNIDIFTIPSEF